jgi:prepilin-type N-terminal cleavage/methylation domain-containing protein
MVSRRRQRGLSLIETAAALAILTIIGAGVTVGGAAHFATIANAHRQTVAVEVVNADLERARRDEALVPGRTEISADVEGLDGATLVRTVTEREPGLLEVAAELRWKEGTTLPDAVRLTTLVAREGVR